MASATASSAESRSERVPLLPNPKHERNGVRAWISALQKYNITPTGKGPYFRADRLVQQGKHGRKVGGKARIRRDVLLRRVRGSGAVDEDEEDEVEVEGVTMAEGQCEPEFLIPVGVGSPAQEMTVAVDTASARFWLWSTKLSAESQGRGRETQHKFFDPKRSATYEEIPEKTWDIHLGYEEYAAGILGQDKLLIGGMDLGRCMLHLTDVVSDVAVNSAGDGSLGLGPNTVIHGRGSVLPLAVSAQTDQTPPGERVFTIKLDSNYDNQNKTSGMGFMTFRYIDDQVLSTANATRDDISWAAIDGVDGFWKASSQSVVVNGDRQDRGEDNMAAFDTATELILVDDAACQAIYETIPGSKYDKSHQGWTFPETIQVGQLPEVSFQVGKDNVILKKAELKFASASEGFVYGAVQSRGNLACDVFGTTFFRSIYAIIELSDRGSGRFGFVQQ